MKIQAAVNVFQAVLRPQPHGRAGTSDCAVPAGRRHPPSQHNGITERKDGPAATPCRATADGHRAAFSVIELLVAMVLLLVITAVFGRFFQRSTQSWESGMRTVEVMIAGRAALNIITRDIERAIADPVLAENFEPDPAFRIDNNNDLRLVIMSTDGAQSVRYFLENNVLMRETDDAKVELIDHVVEVEFLADDSDAEDKLPAEVAVKLRLSSRYDGDDDTARELEFVSRVHPVHRFRYPDTSGE